MVALALPSLSRKARFVVLGVFAGLLVITCIAGLVFWRRATALPAWYTASASSPVAEDNTTTPTPTLPLEALVESSDPAELPPAVAATPARRRSRDVEVTGAQLNSLLPRLVDSFIGVPGASRIVRASRTEIRNGELDVQLVVRLSDMPRERLDAAQRAELERFETAFPFVAKRDVMLGLRGAVTMQGQRPVVSPSTVLRIGEVEVPLAAVLERLHVPPAELTRPVGVRLGKRWIYALALREHTAVLTLQP